MRVTRMRVTNLASHSKGGEKLTLVGGGDREGGGEGDVGVPVAVPAEDEVVGEAAGGGAVVADLGAVVLAREVGGVDLVVAEKAELAASLPYFLFLFFPSTHLLLLLVPGHGSSSSPILLHHGTVGGILSCVTSDSTPSQTPWPSLTFALALKPPLNSGSFA
ncbi:hypothetical protein NL676_026302 [Syzygium grande]|nr:hypothetical protein NL676_026302 [Syzygium grande]